MNQKTRASGHHASGPLTLLSVFNIPQKGTEQKRAGGRQRNILPVHVGQLGNRLLPAEQQTTRFEHGSERCQVQGIHHRWPMSIFNLFSWDMCKTIACLAPVCKNEQLEDFCSLPARDKLFSAISQEPSHVQQMTMPDASQSLHKYLEQEKGKRRAGGETVS